MRRRVVEVVVVVDGQPVFRCPCVEGPEGVDVPAGGAVYTGDLDEGVVTFGATGRALLQDLAGRRFEISLTLDNGEAWVQ